MNYLSSPRARRAATNVAAVGFALEHQSVSNLGYGFAGGAANAEDASTIFWNPAGMTRLLRRQAVVGLNAIYGPPRVLPTKGPHRPPGLLFQSPAATAPVKSHC